MVALTINPLRFPFCNKGLQISSRPLSRFNLTGCELFHLLSALGPLGLRMLRTRGKLIRPLPITA